MNENPSPLRTGMVRSTPGAADIADERVMPRQSRPTVGTGRLITVGYDRRTDGAYRNFISAAPEGVEFARVKNLFRYPNYALYKSFGYVDPLLDNLHWSRPGRVDLIHLLHSVSLGKTPWVSTYETSLPRWHWPDLARGDGTLGLRRMAGPACKRLIALSAAADRIQRRYLAEHAAYRDDILPKLTVLHPPQAVISTVTSKPLIDGRFIQGVMVGSQFFHKGGLQVLRSYRTLLDQGEPLKLVIVSDLDSADYLTHTTQEEVTEALGIIAKYDRNIVHYSKLPNSEVLRLFARSHFGLLPSWGDTYGYTVLEAQACGCPVVTTNIRALPEINNDDCGWICRMPVNDTGHPVLNSKADRERFSRELEQKLCETLRAIVEAPHALASKAEASVQRIARDHDPAKFAAALRRIYDDALGGGNVQ